MIYRKSVFSCWEKFIYLGKVKWMKPFFSRALVFCEPTKKKKSAISVLWLQSLWWKNEWFSQSKKSLFSNWDTLHVSVSFFLFWILHPWKTRKFYCFFRTEDMFKGVKRFLVLAQVAELMCDTVESAGYWRMLWIVVNLFVNR